MKIAQIMKSDSWGEISPAAFDRGIGGREGAMVRLATEWSKLGHEVTTFVPIKKAIRFKETFNPISNGATQYWEGEKPFGFHEYVSINLSQGMLRSFPYDAVVAWECPSVFDHSDILDKQKVRLVHMQVAHFNEGEQEAAEKLSTGVVALSEWARDFLIHDGLSMNGSMLYVRPNGVNIKEYPKQEKNLDKISFVYSSSPDRGLWHLLKMWPMIRNKFPKANLFVAYGVKRYTEDMRWAHSRVGEMCVEIEMLMQQPGVVDLGKIGQKQLAQIQMNATAWLYPADTIQATETGCITAIENMAAGNPCIISDADCLYDEFHDVCINEPLPIQVNGFVYDLVNLLNAPSLYKELSERGRAFAESRDWSVIAPTWIELFKEQNA